MDTSIVRVEFRADFTIRRKIFAVASLFASDTLCVPAPCRSASLTVTVSVAAHPVASASKLTVPAEVWVRPFQTNSTKSRSDSVPIYSAPSIRPGSRR